MTHKSTIDSIRELLGKVRSHMVHYSVQPQERLDDFREAMALLDTLVPSTPPANPVEAALVALDYGQSREWPVEAVSLVARLLPEMKIATRWPPSDRQARWQRSDVATGATVSEVERTITGWRACYPRTFPTRTSLLLAQAESDALSLADGYTLLGGPVVVEVADATITGPVSGTQARIELPPMSEWGPPRSVRTVEGQPGAVSVEYGPVDLSGLLARGERFNVYQRHDWPIPGESCICRRCGLIRERRGNAHIYHEGDARMRRPAGQCRVRVEVVRPPALAEVLDDEVSP